MQPAYPLLRGYGGGGIYLLEPADESQHLAPPHIGERHVLEHHVTFDRRQRDAILLCHFQELGNIEAAAVLGFSSAIGAYGGFFIPMSYGISISMFDGPAHALYLFIVFYVTCIAITWWYYARRNAEMPC